MEKTKVINLSTAIESNDKKERYEKIHLKEPVLIQVEQFYERQAQSASSLPAMRLLISLVSQVPETEIKKMSITDFVQCKDYLTYFLEFESSMSGSN
ncbi:phage tail assembly protein [Providencia sp.]|uniref:phage tail assembly protein n=1 Tax=Providencia sp. TaxID=589 RepID=UPI003F9D7CA2